MTDSTKDESKTPRRTAAEKIAAALETADRKLDRAHGRYEKAKAAVVKEAGAIAKLQRERNHIATHPALVESTDGLDVTADVDVAVAEMIGDGGVEGGLINLVDDSVAVVTEDWDEVSV